MILYDLLKNRRFILLICFVLTVSSVKAAAEEVHPEEVNSNESFWHATTFGAGFGLWQENTRYINTFEINLRQDFKKISYEIGLPVFITLDGSVFTFGTPNQEEASFFASLNELRYITSFFKEVSYHDKKISFGLKPKSFHFQNNLAWGNPLFNAETPSVGSYLYFESKYFHFYTSSIQDPSLMLLKAQWKPFGYDKNDKTKKNIFLKTFQLTPVAYADWQLIQNQNITWGAGIGLNACFWKHSIHRLGFESGAVYASGLLRSHFFAIYGFSEATVGFGGFLQDRLHPSSPLLSSLYPGLREEIVSNTSDGNYIGGGGGVFRYQKSNRHSFDIHLDLYVRQLLTFAYRMSYQLQLDKIFLSISYMKNEIQSASEIANLRSDTSFLGFEFRGNIIKGLFQIGWSTYVSWNSSPKTRSRLYVYLVF